MHVLTFPFPSLEAFCNFPQAEYIANCVYLTQRTLHCNPIIDFPLTPSALCVCVWLSQFYRPWHCCEKQNKHKYFTFVVSVFTVCIKFRINIRPFEPELDYWWTKEHQIREHVEPNELCLITCVEFDGLVSMELWEYHNSNLSTCVFLWMCSNTFYLPWKVSIPYSKQVQILWNLLSWALKCHQYFQRIKNVLSGYSLDSVHSFYHFCQAYNYSQPTSNKTPQINISQI